MLRPFEPGDAARVVELLRVLQPATVETAESLVWRQASEPARALRASWVAEDGGEIAGFATAWFQWYGGEAGKGRLWVGVREDRRRRGLGTALWETAAAHLASARTLTVEVDDDEAGVAFVAARGLAEYDSEVISRLDPAVCRVEPKPVGGFRVRLLRELGGRERDLYAFYGRAGGLNGGDPQNDVAFEEWRAFILGNPLLDPDASVVVVDREDAVVALAWLFVDRGRGRAENEWTATLPELRGRGLARLAKLAMIGLAAERGVREIVTGNGPDNLPIRELNRRLGYLELYVRRDFERAVVSA